MKKFLAILLAALMMLTLFAGCSDKGNDKKDDKKDDTSKSEKVDNEEETTTPTIQDNLEDDYKDEDNYSEISIGNVNGDIYTNAFADIKFTKPTDWVFLGDSELEQLNDISFGDLKNSDFATLLEEETSLFVMLARSSTVNSYGVAFAFEDLEASDSMELTEEEFLYRSFGSEIKEAYIDQLNSEWFNVADLADDNGNIQRVYVKKNGTYMTIISMFAPDEASFEKIVAMFS